LKNIMAENFKLLLRLFFRFIALRQQTSVAARSRSVSMLLIGYMLFSYSDVYTRYNGENKD